MTDHTTFPRVLEEEYVRLQSPPCGPAAPSPGAGLAQLYARIHVDAKEGRRRSALCISGGGIRSATFSLGVLQEVARRGILEKFDYLSTVSGGGYIGSWLSSYVRRRVGGIVQVAEELGRTAVTAKGTESEVDPGESAPDAEPPAPARDPLRPEPDPIVNLRRYSNYLTPKLGLFSGDTWALTATYVRNLLLNWLMLLPILFALLAVPRLLVALLHTPLSKEHYVGAFAFPLLGWATYYLARTRPAHNKASRVWIYTNKGFLTLAVLPFVLASVFLVFVWARTSDAFGEWKFELDGLGSLLTTAGWRKLAEDSNGWWQVALALALTNTISSVVYLVRYAWASRRERRPDVRNDSSTTRFVLKKAALEFTAALVSGVVAAALLYFFAQILFPRPIAERVLMPSPDMWTAYPPTLPELTTELYACFGVPLVLFAMFVQAALFVGLISWYNEEYDREWWARAGGWILLAGVVWIAFAALTIYGPVLIYQFPTIAASLGTGSGLIAILGGRSAKTDAKKHKSGEKLDTTTALNVSLGMIASLFAVFLLALLSLITSEILIEVNDLDDQLRTRNFELLKASTYRLQEVEATPVNLEKRQWRRTLEPASYPAVDVERFRALRHMYIVDQTRISHGLLLVLGVPLIGIVASMFIGVNQFSMHAMYRNRLIRAYLGASRDNDRRKPNPFTGFDPNDDIPAHRLRPEAFWTHSFETPLSTFVSDLVPAGSARRISIPFLTKEAQTAAPAVEDQSGKRKLARYIRDQLSTRTTRLIEEYQADATAPNLHASLVESLSEDLNRIIEEHDLTATAPDGTPSPVRHDGDSLQPWRNRQLINGTFAGLRPCSPGRPYHVINATLNLVSGKELAWQERRAESFTITPLYCGNRSLGYRPSRLYGGPGGISLGTAVAISGAAASPNMGYNSSPALSFLLTLFNVRLGWWLGNPGKHGEATYWRRNPKFSLGPLVDELSGSTDNEHPYVYLSDGGHFENLALYEMIQRRCHDVVLIDAAADPSFGFDDLGNAVRKIRIDLGISITFEAFDIFPRSVEKPTNARYCAMGTIHYGDVDGAAAEPGRLLYIKPAVYFDKESRDIYNYARQNPTFPHETTADQFFSESQFESYRALGEMTIKDICAKGTISGEEVHDLMEAAARYAAPATKKKRWRPGVVS